jgi:hypothetical protein
MYDAGMPKMPWLKARDRQICARAKAGYYTTKRGNYPFSKFKVQGSRFKVRYIL